MKRWQRRVLKGIAALFAAVVILLATVIGVFRLFAPLVPGYRTEVERWASKALDRPVSITGMGARWDWYGPEITLDGVQLYSHDGSHVVITARQIRLGVTLRALLHGAFSAPSRIILIEPHLGVVRDAGGAYRLRGFGNAAGQVNSADWRGALNDAFNQPAEIIVRDGSVTLLDMNQRATPYVFSGVDIKLDNGIDSHRVSLKTNLPPAFGRTLAFTADVQGQGVQPETWRWQVSVSGEALDLPHFLYYWPEYQHRFANGVLDLDAAASGNGIRIDQIRARINAHDLLPASVSAPGFTALSGMVTWLRTSNGWKLNGQDILLAHGAQRWPPSHFELIHDSDALGGETWQGSANFLRLQDLDVLMSWLPSALHSKIQRAYGYSPQGDVSNLEIALHRQGQTLAAWSASGQFHDLGMQAHGVFPGISGMDGKIVLDQKGGTLTLATRNGALIFPHLFRGPLYADELNADFKFTHDAAGWRITSDNFAARNQDGTASGKGSMLFPADNSSPRLDLDATIVNGDVRNKSVYLPVGIMPKEVVDWLDGAIVSGQVPRATLSVHGRLADFPYDNGKGLFDIRFHLQHGVLDYAEGWPELKNLDAEVEFRNQGLSATLAGGNILGDAIAGSKAGFADLRNGVLRIAGVARGGAQSSLEFLRDGPLKERFGHYLDQVTARGHSDVTLQLVLPVDQPDKYTLNGDAHLHEVSVGTQGAPGWSFSQVKGDVHFTGTGISGNNIQGVLLGAPVTLNLQPGSGVDSDSTLFEAHGGADSAKLVTALGLPIKDALSGSTTWTAHGRIPNNPAAGTAGLSLEAASDLQGLGIGLPAPFAKPADASAPFNISLAFHDNGKLQLSTNYAQQVAADIQFISGEDGTHFDRGAISIGGGQPVMPDVPGLSVSGKLDTFDTSVWQSLFGGEETAAIPELPAWLQHLDLRVETFSGFGQTLHGLHLRLDRAVNAWQIALASAAIGGQITLPFTLDAAHPIVANMDHVIWQREKPTTATSTSKQPGYDPRRIPALHFSSKLLQFDGVSLNDVQAVLAPRPDGINLSDLEVGGRTFKASANGSWTAQPDGTQHSYLKARLDSSDIQQTLKAFGYAPGITGEKGELQADIDWDGGPFADIVSSLNGKVHVKLADGQLLEVQPGAGRIFGLLSLNALPRRLLLNFSDVFGKGFGYDRIEGNFTLQQGDAYTRDLTIAGPAAKIHVIGRIGLAKKDFDEALIVDASVGSTLPIIGALAGGVGVGAVVWLLTEVFKKPLTAAGEVRYRLTGPWDNPKLEKVAESPKKTASPKPQPQALQP